FVMMLLFSLAFYGIYARFREQVCTLVCPYGRLQSVLLDNNSIVVAYDQKRGEPRGPAAGLGDESAFGDCLDCQACVRVCPTGIDIRNGTQLECINCTACIDVCNKVMAKAGRRPKLIRYSSYNQLATGSGFRLTGRLIAYGTILATLVGLLAFLTFGRSKIDTTILRTAGSLYEELEGGRIRNLYTIKILNRTSHELNLDLNLKRADGIIQVVGPPLTVGRYGSMESVFAIEIPRESLYSANSSIVIEMAGGDEILDEITTTFNGPDAL
ncbi:MAG: 4Fe-4S dicluster domain-containing protein, partial [Planctomycetota bacterium]